MRGVWMNDRPCAPSGQQYKRHKYKYKYTRRTVKYNHWQQLCTVSQKTVPVLFFE